MKHASKKVKFKGCIAAVLILCLLLSALSTPAYAGELGDYCNWPACIGTYDDIYTYTVITAEEYPDAGNLVIAVGDDQSNRTLFKVLTIPGLNAKSATDDAYNLTLTITEAKGRAKPLTLEKANYYLPVRVVWTANDGRQCDLYIMAVPEFNDYTAAKYTEAHTANANKIWSMYGENSELYSALKACDKGVVGGYHIQSDRCLYAVASSFGIALGGTNLLADYTLRGYDAFLTSYLQSKHVADPTQTKYILDNVLPYYLDYCRRPIQRPELRSLYIAGTQTVQSGTKEYTITLPEGVDWNKVADTMELDASAPYSGKISGAWQSGAYLLLSLYARSTAINIIYNIEANGIIQSDYVLKLTTGEPVFSVSDFALGGRTADITETESGNEIALHLAEDWSWTQEPEVSYTGTGYTFLDGDGKAVEPAADGVVDFTKAKTLRLTLDLSAYAASGTDADTLKFTKDYKLNITQGNSSACELLSFSVGAAEEEVVIDGTNVTVTIPYATEWDSLKASYTCSYDATVTKPAKEDFANSEKTPLKYTVTAENGTTKKEYSVTVKKIPAATDNRILSFSYGNLEGTIDHGLGTVKLKLPAGSSKMLAPTIELPAFATVSPASGEVQDFSSSVTYTVTAQNGARKVYFVTVEVASQAAENPRKTELQGLLDSIISAYRSKAASGQSMDDWEYLNLGLYDLKKGKTEPNTDDKFDIASVISKRKLGPTDLITDLARVSLMLTARGYDCSNLAQYNDGQPFVDANGNKIDNLIENLCCTSPSINGAQFALLALDIGNYTLPENTEHDRAFFLDYLLKTDCKTVAGGIMGLDGVGSQMYAIAPYQNDSVYGERVQQWLQNGAQYIADQLTSDYTLKSWGTTNSEVISWSTMGLCAAGIDPAVDPRFGTSEKNLITQWLDIFSVRDGFKHVASETAKNDLATYEGCYASQWYLNFLENGGNGHPYSLWYKQHDFSKVLSTEAQILRFELEGKQATIDHASGTITLELPKGTPLTRVTPTMTLSDGATLEAPLLPANFVDGVAQSFTVMAEDGKTRKTYSVTVTLSEDVKASGATLQIDSIVLQDENQRELDILSRTVNETAAGTDILLTVDAGVNVKRLLLLANISYGATASPKVDGSSSLDLSDWRSFTITAEDGTTNTYRIKVVSKAQAEITGFRVQAGSEWYSGTIDNARNTITVTGVDDTNLTSTRLTTEIEFTGRTCSPTSGIAVDFANAVTYTLGGDNDLAGRSYTVTVLNKDGAPISASGGSSGGDTPAPATARITAFSVLGVDGVIDNTANAITVTLPAGTDVSAVAPVVTVPAGAVVSPVSGEVVNLTSPLTYTVTLGTESRSYTVSIKYQRSISQQLWDELAENSDVADHQTSYASHGLPGGWRPRTTGN